MLGEISDGANVRLIGLHANYPVTLQYGPDAYIEGRNKPNLAVPSLYDYQLQRRLSSHCNTSH